MSYRGFAVVLLAGIIFHAILMGSVQALVRGWLPSNIVVPFQLLNAALLLVVLWIGERVLGNRLYRQN